MDEGEDSEEEEDDGFTSPLHSGASSGGTGTGMATGSASSASLLELQRKRTLSSMHNAKVSKERREGRREG